MYRLCTVLIAALASLAVFQSQHKNAPTSPSESLSIVTADGVASSPPALNVVPAGFDVAGYYARNSDVMGYFGSDHYGAWQHFFIYGLAEGRQFDSQFIVEEYLLLNADLTNAFGTDKQAALLHWLIYGHPLEDRIGRVPIGFNVDSYLARYPDLQAAFGSITPTAVRNVTVWQHYLDWGVTEGRSDGDFEAYNYLATNADLAAVFGTDVHAAALHWYFYGRREGRRIPAGFDVDGYRTRNPDIGVVWGNDLYGSWLHYRDTGIYEGRTYDDLFRVDQYLALNPDVQGTYGSNLTGAMLHWLYYGRLEGRRGPGLYVPIGILVSPVASNVLTGATAQFTATLTGTTNVDVTWSVPEGSAGGSVSSTGLYTAPAGAGVYHVKATSKADSTKSATATITVLVPVAPRFLLASLRPAPAATNSLAFGYATLIFDGNTNTAVVNVSFSNLTTTETSAYLLLNGTQVRGLGLTQVVGAQWAMNPAGLYSTNDIVNALLTGQVSVTINSANYPGGELLGNFVTATGSQTFTAPAAPPPLATNALTTPTQTDAARFLTQATYGPTVAGINALMARGITGWIDDQMALSATSALAGIRADVTAFPNPFDFRPGAVQRNAAPPNWHAAWFKIAATAPDQLRHRVAFALSEIFVVGEGGCDANFWTEMKARYYDLLANGAFGNYRQVLEDVSLSPTMGNWLTHLHNLKADPVKGTAADENYAREVQQLFSIGLVQLQPDGTLLLDATGQPIPTYDQAMIAETAKVFTGWTYAAAPANSTDLNWFLGRAPTSLPGSPYLDNSPALIPMRGYEAFHDKTAKFILSTQQVLLDLATPTFIPANQTGPQDLAITLDTIFNHPNTGPFVCKQLIQRLVTANPSPGYVYRVALKFANDGTGVRGNLGAVVRAILTDYEARSPDVLANFGYGKIKEPLIRVTSFFRALNVAAPNGRYLDSFFGDPRGDGYWPASAFAWPAGQTAQAPLGAKTVFNFFSPTYSPPGAMAAAGLVSPELEIVDSEYSIQLPNLISWIIYRDVATFPQPSTGLSPFLVPDYSALLPNINNPPVLLDQLNLLFCANQMTAATRATIIATLQSLSAESDLDRLKTAIQFTILSPDGALQK